MKTKNTVSKTAQNRCLETIRDEMIEIYSDHVCDQICDLINQTVEEIMEAVVDSQGSLNDLDDEYLRDSLEHGLHKVLGRLHE